MTNIEDRGKKFNKQIIGIPEEENWKEKMLKTINQEIFISYMYIWLKKNMWHIKERILNYHQTFWEQYFMLEENGVSHLG